MRKTSLILIILFALILSSCDSEDSNIIHLNPGVDTVEINEQWVDSGAHMSSGKSVITVFSEDDIDTSVLGEYEMTYMIELEDKEYEISRMVQVVDQTKPILSLLLGVDTVSQNDTWADGGCEVVDNSLETLSCSTDSEVDTTVVGMYEVIYTSEDSSGNVGTISRIVTVVE